MKKVAVIMARGIEGCGVTKFTLEQTNWLMEHGYDYKLFVSKDKSFSRKNAHDLAVYRHFKFSDDKLLQEMIDECNEMDYIIINSLPAKGNGRGKGAGDAALDNWKLALRSFKRPIVLIQHDHTVYSIKRNGGLDEAIQAADIIFAHAKTNDFSQYVRDTIHINPLAAMLGDDVPTTEIYPFQPGINFDALRKEYWKPIEEQDAKHHKWIGRTTSWKGYALMFEWHNNSLATAGQLTTFEGIEKSPAWLGFKELSDFYNEMDSNPNEVDLSDRYGDKASVFSTFVNDEMLHRMSKVGFGYQLSILKPKYIERSIEYTHCEIAACGTIPVFRKEYGDVCVHRVTGDPLTESKNSGTMWLHKDDVSNNSKTLELMLKLSQDNVMRDEYREMAFEFYKSHQDSEYTFADMERTIEEHLEKI